MKKIPTFLEDILKKMYVEYTKCSKMMNPKTRDNIMLMRNSLVEMFKINPSITYTTVRTFTGVSSNLFTAFSFYSSYSHLDVMMINCVQLCRNRATKNVNREKLWNLFSFPKMLKYPPGIPVHPTVGSDTAVSDSKQEGDRICL